MVAVAVLVVKVTDDSRDGKADARLATALTAARTIYDDALVGAPDEARRIARQPTVGTALQALDRQELREIATREARDPAIASVTFLAAGGKELAAAAKKAGVGERTAWRMLADPVFRREYHGARGRALEQAAGLLAHGSGLAAAVLLVVSQDRTAPAAGSCRRARSDPRAAGRSPCRRPGRARRRSACDASRHPTGPRRTRSRRSPRAASRAWPRRSAAARRTRC